MTLTSYKCKIKTENTRNQKDHRVELRAICFFCENLK